MDVVNARNANQTVENEAVSSVEETENSLSIQEENEAEKPVNEEMSPVQIAEAKSLNGELISEEEAKEASGYGTNGTKLLADTVNNATDKSFSEIKSDMHLAYMNGWSNTNYDLNTDLEREAYFAGMKDRTMQDLSAKENAKGATIYDGVFNENEYANHIDPATREMVTTIAKDLRMSVDMVEKIVANIVNGVEYEANASHTDGKMTISENILSDDKKVTQKIITAMLLHEGGHRMNQLAPQEFGVLMDALYQRAEHLTQRQNLGVSQGMRFDDVVDKYGTNAGLSLDTRGYIEEIATKELEKIFNSPREFNKWYAEISGNKDVRTAFEKFMDFVLDAIERIKKALKYDKMTKEQRAEDRQTLAEFERIKELYANALRAAENVVSERRRKGQNADNKNLESKASERYTNSVNYAFKEYWHTDLTKAQVINLVKDLQRVGNPEATRITSTANWYKGRLNGNDLFVIYSTKNLDEPTILYERKGTGAKTELDILLNLLEEIENGESVDGKSAYVNWVSGGGWMQKVNHSQNNLGNVGRGQNNKNAGVLQSQSRSNGSGAFWSVLENLFEIQENINTKDSEGNTLSKEQQEYFKESKVRNENGNLLVVYHGTSKGGFTIFDTYAYYSKFGLFGNGAYFTDSKEIAESYSKRGKGTKPQIYSSYLNITNPIDMDAKANIEAWNKALQKTGEDFTLLEGEMTNEQAFKSMVEDLEYMEVYSYDASEIVRSVFENMGYDGITHIGGGRIRQSDGTKHRVFISFEPEQIKDIDNTKPTNNPDTRFDLKDSDTNQKLESRVDEGYTDNADYALKNNDPDTIKETEQYTEKEYRNFGWARANNVLNKGQNADYRSKFADAKVGTAKFAKSKSGEYIIPVSDLYDVAFEGINNVLVFAKGTIANPVITSVIEIYEYDETSLDRIRRRIYDSERRGIQQTSGGLFRRYYSSDFELRSNQQRKGIESVGDSGDNGHGKRSGRETSSTKGELTTNFSLKEINDLSTKDQKELLDIIAHLKGEFEVTKFAKADPKQLAKMTRTILKDYSSRADYDTVFKAIDELYTYMANGENGESPVWTDVYNRAYNIAEEIVKKAVEVDDYTYNEYKGLREYLRTTPMRFDSLYDSVPADYENFSEFRKRNFGRLLFTKDGASIDSVYQELSGMYPEFFDEYEATSSADQLERMLDVLGSIQKMEVNPFDRHFKQASMHLANDLTSRFFDIPQAKPTFADKAERRVIEQGIKVGKKVQAVREQRDAKIKKLMESQKEKTKKQLDKIREQRDKKVKAEQEKRRKAISKMSEAQKAKVLRARITRHAGELSKKLLSPTDKQHIPQDLQGAVAKLLECINLESNYTYDVESGSYKKNDDGLPTKRTQAFNALKYLYEKMEGNVTIDPDLMGADGLLSEVIQLSDKRIVDMTSQELETVWQTLRAVEASISTANKMFAEGKFAEISALAEALRTDNADKKEKSELKGVFGGVKNLATLNMLTPETYLHCLGDAGDAIFRMMRDAQDKHISIMKEVSDFTHKRLKDVDVNKLEKTMHTVKLGGEDVKLSTAQLMELYVLMNREQATEHIYVGGILPDITQCKGMKLNTRANPVRNLTPAEISTALSELSAEEKKIADELQKFVSTVLSDYGNEASMKVYNYEKFLEKNYWTIRTNKQEIKSEIGKDTAVTSVANKGMAKGTKPHANTSVRIGSIFDTFASHSSDMATYAAWLGATEDINRIRNFVFWEDGARTGTVKGILDTVHGIHGADYLQKLMTDISIGVKGTDNMNPFDKLVGGYKAASVGANLRVIIQQPTAILRALDMIDAHYLASGIVSPLKGWEKAKKYAPIAQWKDWGHFDINTGRQMKDVLFDNASKLEKLKQKTMWGALMADSIAWGQLWNAVEAETRAKRNDLTVGSEEYYNAVAKRFTEIVDHTQVVDGILQRSQLMRSPDALTKMATAFMGEPTKQYNMAVAAAYDAKNSKGDAKKKAVNRLGRTAVSLAVAGIINAAAQSIVDAMRDDDKEEDYWEKWLEAFGLNTLDTVNVLNYIPYIKDVVSLVSGYSVTRMDTATLEKVNNAIKNMYKAVTGESKYTVAEASAQLFAEIARLYGVPVANVKRDVKSLFMTMAVETNNYLMQYRMEKGTLAINYSGNSKNFMDILYNAYVNDREAYEIIYDDLLKSGYDADKIQSAMETRMKKTAGVEKSSDLTKRYMTPETEKQYDSSLTRIKSSKAWQSANETQRKNAEADLYEFLTSTSDDMVKMRAEATAFGVDETEYVLWQLARDMAESNGNTSLDAKEKASALNMLDLGNSEITYFYST